MMREGGRMEALPAILGCQQGHKNDLIRRSILSQDYTPVVYCATAPSGKQYVGCSVRGLDSRKHEHQSRHRHRNLPFYKALCKYGFDSFSWEILWQGGDPDEMYAKEREFIASMNTKVPRGYNLADGGGGPLGWIPSEETKQKIREANLGKTISEETKRKISLTKKGRAGHKVSAETKRKLREVNLGKRHTEESKRKMSAAHKGKIVSEETKRRMSAARIGKKHSLETRRKISVSGKIRHQTRRR